MGHHIYANLNFAQHSSGTMSEEWRLMQALAHSLLLLVFPSLVNRPLSLEG